MNKSKNSVNLTIEQLNTKTYNPLEKLLTKENKFSSKNIEQELYKIKSSYKQKELNKLLNNKNDYLVVDSKINSINDNDSNFSGFLKRSITTAKRRFDIIEGNTSYKKMNLTPLDISVLKENKFLVKKLLLMNPNIENIKRAAKISKSKEITNILEQKIQSFSIKQKDDNHEMNLRKQMILKKFFEIHTALHTRKNELRQTCSLYKLYPDSESLQLKLDKLLTIKSKKNSKGSSIKFNIKDFCKNLDKLLNK